MSDIDCDNGGPHEDNVCRDFMRNVCTRGRKCRFKHPVKDQQSFMGHPNSSRDERQKLVKLFCHDFQNTFCSREECKYIHCTKEHQDYFVETGSLQPYVIENAISKSIIPCHGEVPVCKDYLSGECRRGKACRYRHLTHNKYRRELDFLFGVETSEKNCTTNNCESEPEPKRFKSAVSSCMPFAPEVSCYSTHNSSQSQGYFPHEKCKLHTLGLYYDSDRCCIKSQTHAARVGMCHHTEVYESSLCSSNVALDEVGFLRARVEELMKQVVDLSAANEYLLEQNAQLRVNRKNNNVAAVTPVSVTVTGTPVSVQPLAGPAGTVIPATAAVPVSIAPGSLTAGGPQQLVGGVNGQGQQLISTGTLSTVTVSGQTSTGQLVTAAVPVSCNAAGQQLMAAVSTVTTAGQQLVPVSCSGQQLVPTGQSPLVSVSGTLTVAGATAGQQLVPVSIATAVPVSISAVSVAPVHIPPPIVTVAQPTSNPPNSMPLTLTGPPNQSLVSYPIRHHSVL